MRGQESQKFVDLAATSAQFELRGGKYGVVATSPNWNSGSATLEILSADGATYVTVVTAFAANGFDVVDLPPGLYQVALATTVDVDISITRIPND